MKKVSLYTILLALTIFLGACEKDSVQIIDTPAAGAKVKLFNFSLNAPAVNFYGNTTKLTAVSSTTGTEAVTGIAFGGVGPGSNYAQVAGGQYTFKGQISAAVDKDLPIASLAATVADGKAYTFYMSGVYNTTAKTADMWFIEDVIPELNADNTFIRFVNAIHNSVPMELYVRNTVGGAVTKVNTAATAYKAGSAFISLPSGVYDLYTRAAGGTVDLIVRAGVSFEKSRYNTVAALGDATIGGTTAVNRARLDNTNNR